MQNELALRTMQLKPEHLDQFRHCCVFPCQLGWRAKWPEQTFELPDFIAVEEARGTVLVLRSLPPLEENGVYRCPVGIAFYCQATLELRAFVLVRCDAAFSLRRYLGG